MTATSVFFYSDGLRIAGHLFAPDDWREGDAPRPAILALGGYSGNSLADTQHIAERLRQEGWFVFVYDYRGYDDSEGQRGRHRPLEQVQNAYDALSYMQTVPGIDPARLGVFGTSFGGANGIWVAAHDERVKALVTSVGVTHGERWLRLVRRPWEWHAFKDRVMEDARRRVRTGEPTMVHRTEILLPEPTSVRRSNDHAASGENVQLERDLESAEATFRFRPEWLVDRISPRPVLMIYAERDALVPPEEQLSCFSKCGEPK
jgi:pimeloyl-ACP methyl ester carboxylesterase